MAGSARSRADGVNGEKSARPSHGTQESTLPLHQQHTPKTSIPVRAAGESGRRGIHPLHFLKIIWRSNCWFSGAVNVLWPVVPIAIAVYYGVEEQHTLKFILAYIGMIPCANLIGFAGQELARKMPHMLGVLTETTIASTVEIILFMTLLFGSTRDAVHIIQAAILGSILATMLLCLGVCFIASGIRREDTTFAEAITEAGSGLLLTAGVGLAVPAVFQHSLSSAVGMTPELLNEKVLQVSRAVAILLLLAYGVFVWFQARTHHGIFEAIFEHDESRDHDRVKDTAKPKLTLTECIVALIISVGLVAIIAIILVKEIEPLVEEHGLSDAFIGLILVPLVEKAAEHLTAADEAWDNQMNFALSHCIGSTLQTALLNAPLVVLVGWIANKDMSLNFEMFDVVMLVLAIITVGNFLRDQKSNYLEGYLCVTVYLAIAVAAFYSQVPHVSESVAEAATEGAAEAVSEAAGH